MDLALLRKLKSVALNRSLSLALSGGLLLTGSAAAEHCLKKQPERPQTSPACEPAWGFHETCWMRFPPLAECDTCGIAGAGCSCMNGGPAGFGMSSGDGPWLGSTIPSTGSGYESGRYGVAPMKPQHVYHNDPGANTSPSPMPAGGGFAPMTTPSPVPTHDPATINPIPSAPVPQTPALPQSRYNSPSAGRMRNVSMQRPLSQPIPQPQLPRPANAAGTMFEMRRAVPTASSSRYGHAGGTTVVTSSTAARASFVQRLQANTAQQPAGAVAPATAVAPASSRYSVRPGSPAQVRLPVRPATMTAPAPGSSARYGHSVSFGR